MVGFRNYVLSERVFTVVYEASDAASCFLNVILEKVEKEAKTIGPIMEELIPAAEYVAANESSSAHRLKFMVVFPRNLRGYGLCTRPMPNKAAGADGNV